MLASDDEQPERPKPWWEHPKPVMQVSGSGFDTEARIVTPDREPITSADDWPPRFHSGVPPSPRR